MTLALESMDHRPLLPRGSEPPLSQGEIAPRPAGEERACPPCTSFFLFKLLGLCKPPHNGFFYCCCCFRVLRYSTKVCSSENGVKDLIPFMQ